MLQRYQSILKIINDITAAKKAEGNNKNKEKNKQTQIDEIKENNIIQQKNKIQNLRKKSSKLKSFKIKKKSS